MSIDRDLSKHAADKVTRALGDVYQLADSPEAMMSIALMSAAACLGQAIGFMRGLMEQDGETPPDAAIADEVWYLIRPGAIKAARIYETEEDARNDWETIAPAHRTQERLQQMLKMVRRSA